MMRYIVGLCALFALAPSLPARAEEPRVPANSAYAEVMRAQYAARTAPLPARPEEAQRIYDAYLRSIGQPVKDSTTDSGGDAGTFSR